MDILMAALGSTCGMLVGVGLVWCIDRFSEWLSTKIENRNANRK